MPKREPLSTVSERETTNILRAAKATNTGQITAIKKDEKPIQDKKVLEYIETAKKVQAQRLRAPLTGVNTRYASSRKNTIHRLSSDSGGQDGTFHWFWGHSKKSIEYVNQGYEPVTENGEHVHDQGSPLWKIPTEFFHAERDAAVERDRQQLRVKTRQDTKTIKQNNPNATEQVTMTRDGVDLLE
jgi:hypothetical protein